MERSSGTFSQTYTFFLSKYLRRCTSGFAVGSKSLCGGSRGDGENEMKILCHPKLEWLKDPRIWFDKTFVVSAWTFLITDIWVSINAVGEFTIIFCVCEFVLNILFKLF